MSCTREIVFFRCTVKVGQCKIITSFEQEAAGFLGSEFYSTTTGYTVIEFVLDFITVNSFMRVCQLIHIYILHTFRFADQESDLRTGVDKELQSSFFSECQMRQERDIDISHFPCV